MDSRRSIEAGLEGKSYIVTELRSVLDVLGRLVEGFPLRVVNEHPGVVEITREPHEVAAASNCIQSK